MESFYNPFKTLSTAWRVAVAALLLIVGVLSYNFVDDWFSAADEKKAEVAQNQGEAAVKAGQAATNLVAEQYTREIVRTNNTERVIERISETSDDYVATHFIGAQRLCDNSGICGQNVVQRPSTSEVEAED